MPTGANLAPAPIEWWAANAHELRWRQDGFCAWGVLVGVFMLELAPEPRGPATLSVAGAADNT